MRSRTSTALLTGALIASLAAPSGSALTSPSSHTSRAPAASPSSSGIGDPYFPRAGNPGYDVRHYGIKVNFRPTSGALRGNTLIRMVPRKRLTRFNLDLLMRADRVLVNGRRTRFSQTTHELTVKPVTPLRRGKAARVRVLYHGRPAQVMYGGERPFKRTQTGGIAVGQPQIAAWWFPGNDHPSDLARYDVSLSVPRGMEGISNGRLVSRRTAGQSTTWRWSVGSPMATYLAFAAMGQYEVTRGRTSGRQAVYAFEKGMGRTEQRARTSLRKTGEATRWLARLWGPYPFEQIGGVVANVNLGYALENQTRPVYGRDMFSDGPATWVVVHELAHQWFGDKVAIRRWRHIWLNEGFATYSEWLWESHRGGRSPQQRFRTTYDVFGPRSRFWNLTIGNPGPKRLFDQAVYERGAMVLQGLRNRVGSGDFFRIGKRWVHDNDGLGSTVEFKLLAERVSGEQLDGFFRHWLFSGAKPAKTPENGF